MKKTLAALLLALCSCAEKPSGIIPPTPPNETSSPTPAPEPTPPAPTPEPAPQYTSALIYMEFRSRENLTYRLPLECFSDRVEIVTGYPAPNRQLHFYEAESADCPNIAPQEYFVATVGDRTRFIQYVGVTNDQIILWTMSGWQNQRLALQGNCAKLDIAGTLCDVILDPETRRIAVDQNGDGTIDGSESPAIHFDRSQIREEDLLYLPQ
ncbi:MAG TPA: hypothetical protein VJJ82_01370 [Candidatus Nanoarchaeia archaeon]|nr:hypothetical protein [Candidatus Nanoarchaeia archaeon]